MRRPFAPRAPPYGVAIGKNPGFESRWTRMCVNRRVDGSGERWCERHLVQAF